MDQARSRLSPRGAMLVREACLALRSAGCIARAVDQHAGAAWFEAFRPDGLRVGMGVLKLGAVEVCPFQVDAAQIGPPQVGILQMGVAEVSSGQTCALEVGLTQVDV